MNSSPRFTIYDLRFKRASQSAIGFTLIELLVVIAIIAILAAMLMPVLSSAMKSAKKTEAKTQISEIETAIIQYESQYSRMPVSSAVQQSGVTNVTYGGVWYSSTATPTINGQWPVQTWTDWPQGPGYYTTEGGLYITNNSDVMSILMDVTNFPNTTQWTINTNYQKNPMQTIFLSKVKMVSDTVSPGIGTDLNYRDPWGNPYIITMDLNEDNKCEDPFYAPFAMSSATGVAGGAGVNGLNYQSSDGNYAFHGNVMVWSMGPNGPFNHSPSSFTYSLTAPTTPTPSCWAQDASNKQHIMSWVQ